VQEILDFGLYGLALSRFAGVWVGLKLMKDTVEATAVVDGRPDRMPSPIPSSRCPRAGSTSGWATTGSRRRSACCATSASRRRRFRHSNGIDKRMHGKPGAKIGFVAAGKNWLDLLWALDALGIDEAEAERLGITTYKVGQTWPLDMKGFKDWAEGLELIVVVEEKRKLIEVQVKEAIFDDRRGRASTATRTGRATSCSSSIIRSTPRISR
jgi:indolepyruvate ferredoxin oxidoreductase